MTPNFPLRLFFSSEKHQISLEPLTFRLERGTSYVELQLHLFNIFYFKLDDARAKKESVVCARVSSPTKFKQLLLSYSTLTISHRTKIYSQNQYSTP